jgi:hypothetical protein
MACTKIEVKVEGIDLEGHPFAYTLTFLNPRDVRLDQKRKDLAFGDNVSEVTFDMHLTAGS